MSLRVAIQAGRTHDGLIHICDWVATFAELAGVPADGGEPHAVAPLDSVSAWAWLSGGAPASARTEVVYEHNMFSDPIERRGGVGYASAGEPCYLVNVSGAPRCAKGALRRADGWKLVVGPERQNLWAGWFSPNASHPIHSDSPAYTAEACMPHAPCLFNLNASGMAEHADVSAEHPDVVAALLRRFEQLAREYHPPMHDPPLDLAGLLAAVELNGGFVGPWMAEPVVEWPAEAGSW